MGTGEEGRIKEQSNDETLADTLDKTDVIDMGRKSRCSR